MASALASNIAKALASYPCLGATSPITCISNPGGGDFHVKCVGLALGMSDIT